MSEDRDVGELKPCPFCSGERFSTRGNNYAVVNFCDNCGAVGPNEYEFEGDWNARPIEDALRSELAKVKGERDEAVNELKSIKEWMGYQDVADWDEHCGFIAKQKETDDE